MDEDNKFILIIHFDKDDKIKNDELSYRIIRCKSIDTLNKIISDIILTTIIYSLKIYKCYDLLKRDIYYYTNKSGILPEEVLYRYNENWSINSNTYINYGSINKYLNSLLNTISKEVIDIAPKCLSNIDGCVENGYSVLIYL